MHRQNYVSIVVDGCTYNADTPFNLRNLLLGRRNDFHEAARVVEQAMEQNKDPLLKHVSRLSRRA